MLLINDVMEIKSFSPVIKFIMIFMEWLKSVVVEEGI